VADTKNERPPYFERVRGEASRLWNQLDSNPALAGPWHQLFKQVQSPRHVLSELLQNADDAGATKAFAELKDGVFVFGHNGRDFSEDEFRSLCRFGYSNKRVLRTIGFRGIGFKSTFSLGNVVELRTPTLSVAFDKSRFTEPRWLGSSNGDGQTLVRIDLADKRRERELERNFDAWSANPLSLLFFRNLTHLRVGTREIERVDGGHGPVARSRWVALGDDAESRLLVCRSESKRFPAAAIQEIREQRMLFEEEDLSFAPCAVEIVLGAPGRLYVVLPTDVRLNIPFACNAPFVQDPARDRIKEISPTNRWLLERIGSLAASVMVEWLKNKDLPLSERAEAYELLPSPADDEDSLSSACARVLVDAFRRTIEDEPCLLTEEGEVVAARESVMLPSPLLGVWSPVDASTLLDEQGRPPLHRNVTGSAWTLLEEHELAERVTDEDALRALRYNRVPKPDSWEQLARLWAFVAPNFVPWHRYSQVAPGALRVVPVAGAATLAEGDSVVNLRGRIARLSDEDAGFLRQHLRFIDPAWLRHLKQDEDQDPNDPSTHSRQALEAAQALLEKLGLDKRTDATKAVEFAAKSLFAGSPSIKDAVRLARMAARLNARIGAGSAVRFVTRDGRRAAAGDLLLFDSDGSLEELLPSNWAESHLLHPAYGRAFSTCSREEWHDWIASGRSPLWTSPPLRPAERHVFGRERIRQEVERRGGSSELNFPYVTDDFTVKDWDFPPELWEHWRAENDDPHLWGRIMEAVLTDAAAPWREAISASAQQIATTGRRQTISSGNSVPTWVLAFRELPCLRDDAGRYQLPCDLLRRTRETEALVGVETFVHRDFDTEETRELLTRLEVGDKPRSLAPVLNRVRALAEAPSPPVDAVENLYRRLDRLCVDISTDELGALRAVFSEEALIVSDDGDWQRASAIFLSADEDEAPGVAVVLSAVRGLTLWKRIGVQERPTAEHAIAWLSGLDSGERIAARDVRRVRALLRRHPERIWAESGHWLNVADEWVPVGSLRYALHPEARVKSQHLHEWVTAVTADFRMLSREALEKQDFSRPPSLAEGLERRLESGSGGGRQRRAWLERLGSELMWIVLADEEEQVRIRALASRLAKTAWADVAGLRVSLFLDGRPAGTPYETDVAWIDDALYVEPRPIAAVASAVSQELASVFVRPEIGDAIKLCFDRDPAFVRDYVQATFELEAPEAPHGAGDPSHSAPEDDEVESGSFGDAAWSPKEEHPADVDDLEDDEDLSVVERRRGRRRKLTIMERFAIGHGFEPTSAGVFVHPDGTRIVRNREGLYPWEKRSATGEVICRYWAKDHCLERQPLEIGADVWNLLEAEPNLSALVLANAVGEPTVLTGAAAAELKAGRELRLYPASYRVRLERGRDASVHHA
jgi:hypothetical protein